MGVSLNGGYPHFTPQVLIIFSRKTPWFLGKPTILGNLQIHQGELLGRCDLFWASKHWMGLLNGPGTLVLYRSYNQQKRSDRVYGKQTDSCRMRFFFWK